MMTKAPVVHWRKTKHLKPPCGKVSMYVKEDRTKVTCPECLLAMHECSDTECGVCHICQKQHKTSTHWTIG